MVKNAKRKDLKDRLVARTAIIKEGVENTRSQIKAQGGQAPAEEEPKKSEKKKTAEATKGSDVAKATPEKPKEKAVKKLTESEKEKLVKKLKLRAEEYKSFATWLSTNNPDRREETVKIVANYKAATGIMQELKSGIDPGVEKFMTEKFPIITCTTVLGQTVQEKQTQMKTLSKKLEKLVSTLNHYKAQKDTLEPLKDAKQFILWLERIHDNEWCPIPRLEVSQLKVRNKEENSGYQDNEFRLKIKSLEGAPARRDWYVEYKFEHEGQKCSGTTDYDKHGELNYSKRILTTQPIDKNFADGAK